MDVSDFFFFGLGEGKGESGATGTAGGFGFSLKIPGGGGGLPGEGGGGERGPRGCLRGIWGGGGGLNIFFRGRNSLQDIQGLGCGECFVEGHHTEQRRNFREKWRAKIGQIRTEGFTGRVVRTVYVNRFKGFRITKTSQLKQTSINSGHIISKKGAD